MNTRSVCTVALGLFCLPESAQITVFFSSILPCKKIRSGEQAADAIVSSAPMRLRPILMTLVAMIVGMLPVATGWGAGGAARMPLGIATIGGVVSSTLLTLFVVPNFFVFIEKMRRMKSDKNS
ncbi:MAG: efflux RND transporter permease subunit [Proteobacteria bacterium]|nr:efflux RND transporter permease subunit [Pseudomonadota bacterium]